MLIDFILHKANGTDTVELNKSIDGYSVVLNPKLHDVYNQVSYVEFDVAMSMDNYIEIGDWIEVDGKKYYSLTNFASFNARIAKGGTYNVRFYSPEQWLYKANMYATNEIYSGGVYSWERVDNTIVTVGNLESFGRWLCWNTNAQQNTRMFKLGNVPTGMDEQYEVLDFNPANCLFALYSICKTYKVRYEVVPNTEASPDSQYIINFYDTDEVFPVTFKYEEENGLYKLELTGCDEEVYTQFEIAGSTENIPSFYRDTRLRLSESISALSILDYPDLYDKWGRSIKILTYENIKPTRTGTVTDIVVDDIYSFIDSSLIGATWSPVGGTIQVVEGPLMGFSFECDYFNSTNGRVHIKPMTESNGMELPSADLSYYRFTAGATPTRYNVVGIALPNEYIEDAEARLLAAAMNDTSYYSDIRASYSLAISGTLLEEGEYEINAGVLVPIQHLGIGLDRSVRVQSITYDLSKPKYYDIEEIQLSDFRQEGLMDMVTEGVRKSVATLKDVGYTNKLNTFANSVSTIKQGIAKSLGYESWEDFVEKTWNGEDGSWEPSTIIVDSLINSDLINVNTLIAREAFISTLLANELFISGVQDETESLVNNYLLYLTSSVATVSCDSEGTVTGTLPTSTAIVYHGASADTGWSFSGEFSGCTGSVNSSTGIITITGLTADDSTVTVSATKADKPMLQSIFRISKVYAGVDGIDGEDGADSVMYYLTPSVDAVIRSMDGTATPSTVSCAQYKIQGGGTPVAANKTIKYQRSIDGTMQTYSTAVAVSTSIYIDFYLYDGVTELWRTRVPVLHDLDEWESTLNDFAKGLGYTDTVGGDSAYEKLVGAALAGKTIMEGGYLRNSLIDTEHLIADDAFINRIATNSITIGKITDTAAALDDAMQVGGRNLLLNSAKNIGIRAVASGIVATHESNGISKFVVSAGNGNWAQINISHVNESFEGKQLTISFAIRGENTNGVKPTLYINGTVGGGYMAMGPDTTVTSEWQRIYVTFTMTGSFNLHLGWGGCVGTYYISKPKLEYGNKATDWTPAPEDVQEDIDAAASAAAAAQSAADDAQDDADAANALLTNIASDSKLTASEKQAAQKEWDIIQAEKTKNDTQADLYSVSKTAYTNAYNALNTYLTSLLSDLGTTSAITGSVFRGKFKDYYNARTDLLNAISNAAKAAAEATAAALDDAMQIGGRNLLKDTKAEVRTTSYLMKNYYLGDVKPQEGEQVTIMFRGALGTGKSYFGLYNSGGSINMVIIKNTDKGADGIYRKTFNWKILTASNTYLSLYHMLSSVTAESWVAEVMLVIGNKVAYYSEAPEDLQAKIDANASALSDFEGAVTTSISGLQAQIDGVVDSWFYAYTPTTANYPASEWTTAELKQRHIGDTFTNTQAYVDEATTPDAGKSWRWVESSGVYSWTPIADSDAVKALLAASTAQDTADGKRRVFTTTPTPPYDKDDLWSGTIEQSMISLISAYENPWISQRMIDMRNSGDSF